MLAHGECPGGKGYAKLIIDYSQEHHIVWLVSIDGDDGEGQPWCVENKHVRFPPNTTMGRYRR